MPNDANSQARQALVDELDQLVHMLGDGPEFQHEMPLPQEDQSQSSFSGIEVGTANDEAVPVLTSIFEPDSSAGEAAQLDILIEELIEELLPRFETLLRARLKTRLTTPKK